MRIWTLKQLLSGWNSLTVPNAILSATDDAVGWISAIALPAAAAPARIQFALIALATAKNAVLMVVAVPVRPDAQETRFVQLITVSAYQIAAAKNAAQTAAAAPAGLVFCPRPATQAESVLVRQIVLTAGVALMVALAPVRQAARPTKSAVPAASVFACQTAPAKNAARTVAVVLVEIALTTTFATVQKRAQAEPVGQELP